MNIYKLAHKIVYSYDGLIKAGNLQQAPRNTTAFDAPTLKCITPKKNKYRQNNKYSLLIIPYGQNGMLYLLIYEIYQTIIYLKCALNISVTRYKNSHSIVAVYLVYYL